MTIGLFYDTETTGLPDFKAPSESAHQPYIVQIAAKLVNLDTKEVVHGFEAIIKPDGWAIPEEVAKVHGITTERALEEGLPGKEVIAKFMQMWEQCAVRIAHNESFDERLLRIALLRYADKETAVHWKEGEAQCTAELATPVVKCPPTAKMLKYGFNKYKKPNLTEAYTFFFGKGFDNAHTAMADVDACIEIYFAMKEAKNETN